MGLIKKRNYIRSQDVDLLIKEAIKRLPNGEFRLLVSKFPLKYICLDGFWAPDFTERLLSSHGVHEYPTNKKIEKQFYEEIEMIENLIEEMGFLNKQDDLEDRVFSSLTRRSYAMKIWDYYAIPWRFDDEIVHLIWSPEDLMGTPIIHSCHISYFLSGLPKILEERNEVALRQARHLIYWRIFGIIALIIIGLVAWAIIEKSLVWR